TPLGVTAACGHCNVLEHLNNNTLDDRASVLFQAAGGRSGNVPGEAGLLPIHSDLGGKYIIAATSQTLIQDSGSRTLHSAVDGQNQCLELVIENSLDVNTLLSEHITSNTYDDRRDTALCCAVSNNEILYTKILVKEGANLNKDPLNCALMAVRADSHGIVKLLSYGEDTGDMMLRLLLSHGYNVEMCLDFMCQGIFRNSFV
uniref:Uncharacterized protein n=1 Tax=Catharus ustulatus TaxID=91951 RepID=A0A8C3TX02_CATUS